MDTVLQTFCAVLEIQVNFHLVLLNLAPVRIPVVFQFQPDL